MKTKEISEDEMVSIIYDALEIYIPEVYTAWSFDDICRSKTEFAKDYVAHLYSTWRSKAEKEKTQ